jgi:YD repeat-containing protein
MRRPVHRCLVLVAVLLSAWAVRAQTPVRYVYDDLGRLLAVIDQNGDAATYGYDSVGNITSITRTSAGNVKIFAFSPTSSGVGATVTLYGMGFSATPAQNAVAFNGTSATVSSATTMSVVVTVPPGATTGTVSITTPSGSAVSASAFVVAAAAAPTITSFSPTAGPAGTTVTVSGTNFETVLANNKARINRRLTTLSAGTTSSLTTSVPAKRGSGKVTVDTPAGSAVSADDFIVPPVPYTPSDVAVSGRLPYGTPTTVTMSTATKIALMLFDASPGQRVSIVGTNGSFGQNVGCDMPISLRNPETTTMGLDTCMEQSGFMDVKTTDVAGTYTVLIDPPASVTGSVTLTLHDVPADASGTISPGGAAVTVTTTVPGQNGGLTFTGTAGQRVSLKGTNAIANQVLGCDLNVSILRPDGSVLASPTCMEGSGYIDVVTLPTTGTYRIVVDPVGIATGSITLTLYDVPVDYSGTITPGGSPVTTTTTTPGQNATLTFSGTTGQRISLRATNVLTGQVIGCDVNLSVTTPSSGSLIAPTCIELGAYFDVVTLPATGTYTVSINPVSLAVGSATLTVYDVPADVTGTITAGGSAATATTTIPGQNGKLTFSGTSGQRIALRGTNGMTGQISFICDVNVSIVNPDTSVLASPTCMEGSGFIDVRTLPATGTMSGMHRSISLTRRASLRFWRGRRWGVRWASPGARSPTGWRVGSSVGLMRVWIACSAHWDRSACRASDDRRCRVVHRASASCRDARVRAVSQSGTFRSTRPRKGRGRQPRGPAKDLRRTILGPRRANHTTTRPIKMAR